VKRPTHDSIRADAAQQLGRDVDAFVVAFAKPYRLRRLRIALGMLVEIAFVTNVAKRWAPVAIARAAGEVHVWAPTFSRNRLVLPGRPDCVLPASALEIDRRGPFLTSGLLNGHPIWIPTRTNEDVSIL
jgi:hypothetical protein